MDNDSPFAKMDVPIVGQAKIINLVAVVGIQCNCEAKTLLMGTVGSVPLPCNACNKAWIVEAQVAIKVMQIANPVTNPDTLVQ